MIHYKTILYRVKAFAIKNKIEEITNIKLYVSHHPTRPKSIFINWSGFSEVLDRTIDEYNSINIPNDVDSDNLINLLFSNEITNRKIGKQLLINIINGK